MKIKTVKIKANVCESEPVIENSKSENSNSGLVQYSFDGYVYRPCGNIKMKETLKTNVYEIGKDMQGLYLKPGKVMTDDLLRFNDKRQKTVLSEIDKFWNMRSNFEDFGFLHKRGILLYGSPGTGKSALIKLVMNDIIDNDDIILKVKEPRFLTSALEAIRSIEPRRRVLAVLEDVDEMCKYDEHTILQLFDGDSQQDGVLFIGTTNYLDKLPPRVLRTGRFDRKIEIGVPDHHGRLAYFNSKLRGKEHNNVIAKIVSDTEGLNFSQLKEVLISTYVLGYSLKETLDRIKNNLEPFNPEHDKSLDRQMKSRLNANVIKKRKLFRKG